VKVKPFTAQKSPKHFVMFSTSMAAKKKLSVVSFHSSVVFSHSYFVLRLCFVILIPTIQNLGKGVHTF
jgi:hypothetical protein